MYDSLPPGVYLSDSVFPAVGLTVGVAREGTKELTIFTEAKLLPDPGTVLQIDLGTGRSIRVTVDFEKDGVLTLTEPLEVYVPERVAVHYFYGVHRLTEKREGKDKPYLVLVADNIRVEVGSIVWLVCRVGFITYDWWHLAPQRVRGFDNGGVFVGAPSDRSIMPPGVLDLVGFVPFGAFSIAEVFAEKSLALKALLAQGKTYATDEMIDAEFQARWGAKCRWYGWDHELKKCEEKYRATKRS